MSDQNGAFISISGNPSFHAQVEVNIYEDGRTQRCGGVETLPESETTPVCTETDYIEVVQAAADVFHEHRGNDQIYEVKSIPKGCVLIINNHTFQMASTRRGSKKDVHDMIELWQQIGCEVTVKKNLTATLLEEEVDKFTRSVKEADFYVFIIMSHGKKDDLIVGTDGGKTKVLTIFNTIVQSDKMSDKPKLLFFQMCRGSETMTVWDYDTDAEGYRTEMKLWMQELLDTCLSDDGSHSSISEVADDPAEEYVGSKNDVLLAFATQPGYRSIRHKWEGSWFIQLIRSIFSRHAATDHVKRLMEMVQTRLRSEWVNEPNNRLHGAIEIMDWKESFRNKDLYLFPGFPKRQRET